MLINVKMPTIVYEQDKIWCSVEHEKKSYNLGTRTTVFTQNIWTDKSLANSIRGPGTNYINISHESKAERSSEDIIWQMDASDWMMRLKLKYILFSSRCKN